MGNQNHYDVVLSTLAAPAQDQKLIDSKPGDEPEPEEDPSIISVEAFWDLHYHTTKNGKEGVGHGINAASVFRFFENSKFNRGESYEEFVGQSLKVKGLCYLTQTNGPHHYMAIPKTDKSSHFHQTEKLTSRPVVVDSDE